jgi:diketogulonate reductase-like aldo/keto reductase
MAEAGLRMPRLGMGTWHLGVDAAARRREMEVLRLGLDLGVTLVDAAEMYGDGGAEALIGEALAERRDEVFLVTKFYPQHAAPRELVRALEGSLARLRTATVDLYLYHWRGPVPLAQTVAALEELVASGHIGRWGVSNFDVDDMEELFGVPGGDRCAANQVLYNLAQRGIEYDLLPWCRDKGVAVMAYSVLDEGRLPRHPVVRGAASELEITPAQLALAWVLRQPSLTALCKASRPEHLRANRRALELSIDERVMAELDRAFPPPRTKIPLAVY